MPKLISAAEYARTRGVSRNAVSKAIAGKRISFTTDANGRKLIDPDVADVEWAANTDVKSQRRGAPQQFAKTQPLARSARARLKDAAKDAGDVAGAARPSAPQVLPDGSSLLEESTRLARVKTMLAELDLQQRRGDMVSATAIRALYATKLLAAREMLEAIPDRISARLAVEQDAEKVHRLITTEIRAAMLAAAQDPVLTRN